MNTYDKKTELANNRLHFSTGKNIKQIVQNNSKKTDDFNLSKLISDDSIIKFTEESLKRVYELENAALTKYNSSNFSATQKAGKNSNNNLCPNCPDPPTFGFYISFGTDGVKFGLKLSFTSLVIGNFHISHQISTTYFSDYYKTGKSGIQIRNSAMAEYDYGYGSISLSTNKWHGLGKMSEFDQTTGKFSFNNADLRLSYENDGTPFQWLRLADGNDSHKSAAIGVGFRDWLLMMRLLTGKRDKTSYYREQNILPGGELGLNEFGEGEGRGKFGEFYKHGFVDEIGPKYRFSELSINHMGYSMGVDFEWIRHIFQNIIAHKIIEKQRMFQMMSGHAKPLFNVKLLDTNSLNPKETRIKSKFTHWEEFKD